MEKTSPALMGRRVLAGTLFPFNRFRPGAPGSPPDKPKGPRARRSERMVSSAAARNSSSLLMPSPPGWSPAPPE